MPIFTSLRGISPRNVDRRFRDDFFTDRYHDLVGHRRIENDDLTLPSANIREHEHAYEIELAAPGMDREDFDIQIDDSVLTVRVEECKNDTRNATNYNRREFCYATFSRSFSLPEHTNEEEIKATYENGILRIHVPVHDTELTRAPRRIAIS